MLDAKLLASKVDTHFDGVVTSTQTYIDVFAKDKQEHRLFSVSPAGHSASIALYNFSEAKVDGEWELATDREKVDASNFIILLSVHQVNLFLNPDMRDLLLHEWLNIASGRIPVYALIQQATEEDGRTPLTLRFKKLDPLTQLYIIFQLRMMMDVIIKSMPLDDPDVVGEFIARKTQIEWGATAAFLRKHETFRMQVYDKLDKFLQRILPTSRRSIASSQKEMDAMLNLILFYFSSTPKGTLQPVIATPMLPGSSGASTPDQMRGMRSSLLLSELHSMPIKAQLDAPYSISESLSAEISLCYGALHAKYVASKKDESDYSDRKLMQQYFAMKEVNEAIVTHAHISPQQVESAFKKPELVEVNRRRTTLSKDLVFRDDWSFFESPVVVIYRRLKEELTKELWDRVKTFDFVYDLIIANFSHELANRLNKEYDKLKSNTPWFIEAGKFDVSKLSRMDIGRLHKRLAIDIIHHAFQNGRMSVSLMEEVMRRFPEYGAHLLPFTSSEMQGIVDTFRLEMEASLWKMAADGFSRIEEYKAPDVTPRWSGVSLS